MTLKLILSSTKKFFLNLTKAKVVELLVQLQKSYIELEQKNTELKVQLQKIEEINKIANKPSSKHAEWEKVTPIEKNAKNGQPKKRKAIKGSGNQTKNHRQPDKIETEKVDICDTCGKNLKNTRVLESTNEHIVEDIPEPAETTEVIKIIKEKKYCTGCQKVTTAKSERAMLGADIGLKATVLIVYLWVALCLPFPKIKDYLASFFGLKISTPGLSRHIIMVSNLDFA